MLRSTDIIVDEHLDEFGLDYLKHGSYLLLTDIHLTPPHCSLLTSAYWMSLNFNECKTNVPADVLFKMLLHKSISTVFLELNKTFELSMVQNIFSKYQNIDVEQNITCISPIKEILIQNNLPVSFNDLLFEMIDKLYAHKEIKKVYALNYSQNEYKLSHYTSDDLKMMVYEH